MDLPDLTRLWPEFTPDLSVEDNKAALDDLLRWRADTPCYEGDDPRAVHYRNRMRTIDAAILALVVVTTQQTNHDGSPKDPA